MSNLKEQTTIRTTDEQIEYNFNATIRGLKRNCQNYWEDDFSAIYIANDLRKLLHSSKSPSLFSQFLKLKNKKIKDINFFDTSSPNDDRNIFNSFPLLELTLPKNKNDIKAQGTNIEGFNYLPKCYNRHENIGKLISFNEWWNNNLIIRDKKEFQRYTRRKLIVNCVANKEGVHVDSELPINYSQLINGEFGGDGAITISCPQNKRLLLHNTIRQIAEEFLETLSQCKPTIS